LDQAGDVLAERVHFMRLTDQPMGIAEFGFRRRHPARG
jgi:hypothetical protein